MDVVSTRSGKHIGGTYWTILLRSRAGFTKFQVVQDTPDGVTVRFIRDDRFDAGVLEYYTQRIREKCGAEFQVLFQEEKELERTAAGKRRLVVSNVDRTLPA